MIDHADRIAINAQRLDAKRSRVFYPTVQDMTRRKAAVCRIMTFENLNFVARTREALLRGDFAHSLNETLQAKTMIRSALQKARRNGESAKYSGCALYRI